MGREQDWKEIEKSQMNYEQNLKDQYKGVDIIKLSKENRKTVHKIHKVNVKLDKLLRALLIMYAVFIILAIIIGTRFYINYLTMEKNTVNVDVIEDLKTNYGINVKVIKKELDKSRKWQICFKVKRKTKD